MEICTIFLDKKRERGDWEDAKINGFIRLTRYTPPIFLSFFLKTYYISQYVCYRDLWSVRNMLALFFVLALFVTCA